MIDLIPKCLLTDQLRQKTSKRATKDFHYLSQLSTFLKNVKQDIPAIHVLFPQFTPHDDLHHLEPLFRLASNLLGETLLKELNLTELFLLACALYGHDWGMGMDEQYKQKLMSRGPEADKNVDEDRRRLRLFLANLGKEVSVDSAIGDLDMDTWREFVRRTHAQRSSDRVRSHFETIDTGVAIRLAQLCQSHGDDCEKLRDQSLYPLRCSVLGEVVNIRALAVYLRLSDLFDLADNRTPYAIWKYVAPTDPRSVSEWDKHRAIRQVTFPLYPGNVRHVLVDGSTDDNELYAELEDLGGYCQKELKLGLDILSEMPDSKYYMDIVSLDWEIHAEGFKPVSARFEFDREKMLGFLSHELYEGDKLVFLRELLQNSIDAIRMRHELLRKGEKAPDLKNVGYIEVFVEDAVDGSIRIVWTDNGIGMDEKTICSFLAVIGRSYYRSHDFQQLKLSMDPISEFGIGLLTCFTVSDTMQIVTKRDQNIFSHSKPLRVQIPSVDRHFRIEEIELTNTISPGTTIELKINSETVNSLTTGNTSPQFITAYLRKIAGFVQFPIIVHEKGKNTIILHPEAKPEVARTRFGTDYDIVQLQLSCGFEDLVISEDIPTAKQILKMETYDLSKDLGLGDYEGVLCYPVPLEEDMDFTGGPREYDALKVLMSSNTKMVGKFVRMMRGWKGQLLPVESRIGEMYLECNNVYRDGILVPHVEMHTSSFSRPSPISHLTSLIANIPKTRAKEISLARNQIVTDSRVWAEPIFSAHTQALRRRYCTPSQGLLKPSRYLFRLASFMLFHGLSIEQLREVFTAEDWPFPFLQTHGGIEFKRYGELIHCPINLSPDCLSYANTDLMQCLMEDKEIPQLYSFWRGPDTVIDDYATWGGSNDDSIILSSLRHIITNSIEISHRFDSIIFLSPPWDSSTPLLQEIWVPKKDSDHLPSGIVESKLALLSKNPSNAFVLEEPYVQERFFEAIGASRFHMRLTRFPKPFEKSFAYGNNAMNLGHPIARALLYLLSVAFAHEDMCEIPSPELQAMRLILRTVITLPGAILSEYDSWANSTDDLWTIVNKVNLGSHLGVSTLTPAIDEFVSGSTEQFLYHKVNSSWNRPFGELIK
ncbi:MAG: ATP-binding protein [Dehalococcoidia bacterium]|nr:ATP-binding protein [Dehalococcoidia bacterium]